MEVIEISSGSDSDDGNVPQPVPVPRPPYPAIRPGHGPFSPGFVKTLTFSQGTARQPLVKQSFSSLS